MFRHEIPYIDPTDGKQFVELIRQATVLRSERNRFNNDETDLKQRLYDELEPTDEEYGLIARGLRTARRCSQSSYGDYAEKTSELIQVASRLSGGKVSVESLVTDLQPIAQSTGPLYEEEFVGYVSEASGLFSRRAGLEIFSDNLDLRIETPPQLFHKPRSFRVPLFDESGEQLVSIDFN